LTESVVDESLLVTVTEFANVPVTWALLELKALKFRI
jgi:hypothetical protein